VPITPDDTGYVAAGSNSVGIHGSFFMYSDCDDGIKPCSTVTTPNPESPFTNSGGKLCTSGTAIQTVGAASQDWGAGIGLEMDDVPAEGGQQPFNVTAAGIKGFCFILSGSTIPSTSIRVAAVTSENQDWAPYESVTAPGMQTVLFSDMAQAPNTAASHIMTLDLTKVKVIQWQIPASSSAAVPWDFCIQGVTAITD
jgi:hypothetical protein